MTRKILAVLRSRIAGIRLKRLLNNQFESLELRRLFRERYGIVVGLYSYGCFDVQRIARGTQIGRYCSFAPTAFVFNGNHGLRFLSLHPYLYNPALGMVEKETITRGSCTFEDDVWVGHGSIILPAVARIGRGSVIAAGSVVTKDVPRYAIVAGNPAAVKSYRFSESVIARIEETQWWLLDHRQLADLAKNEPDLVYRPVSHFQDSRPSAKVDA